MHSVCSPGSSFSRLPCRPQLSVFGQPFVIGDDAKHHALPFGIGQLFYNSARFFRAISPVLGMTRR
jgi:hypothetical protein